MEKLDLEKVNEVEETEIDCECASNILTGLNCLILGILFIGFLSFWCYMAYRNDQPKLITDYIYKYPCSAEEKAAYRSVGITDCWKERP